MGGHLDVWQVGRQGGKCRRYEPSRMLLKTSSALCAHMHLPSQSNPKQIQLSVYDVSYGPSFRPVPLDACATVKSKLQSIAAMAARHGLQTQHPTADNAESCTEPDEPASQSAASLAQVSHRLQRLERAVREHMLGARAGGTASEGSILETLYDSRRVYNGVGSDAAARAVEHAHLREGLALLKADVSELAAREVEAALLQQRVARLEVAMGATPGGTLCGAGRTSMTGSMAGGSEVGVLSSRLNDIEGAVRDLASALEVGIRPQQPLSQEQPPVSATRSGSLCSPGDGALRFKPRGSVPFNFNNLQLCPKSQCQCRVSRTALHPSRALRRAACARSLAFILVIKP